MSSIENLSGANLPSGEVLPVPGSTQVEEDALMTKTAPLNLDMCAKSVVQAAGLLSFQSPSHDTLDKCLRRVQSCLRRSVSLSLLSAPWLKGSMMEVKNHPAASRKLTSLTFPVKTSAGWWRCWIKAHLASSWAGGSWMFMVIPAFVFSKLVLGRWLAPCRKNLPSVVFFAGCFGRSLSEEKLKVGFLLPR